jgi:hypothetical protein
MDHWRLAYLGMRQIPQELSEFELATFFTYSPKERALIDARRRHQPETRMNAWACYPGKLHRKQRETPYRREHINRFGDYLLDLQRRVPPLDPSIDFLFKSAASPEMWRIFCESRPTLISARHQDTSCLLALANIDHATRGSRRLRFRHGQRKHTIVKLCQGVIGVGVFRHGNRAHEASIGAL